MNKSSKTDSAVPPHGGERIAKVMARAGLASRRGAEAIIAEGRVTLNGQRLDTPAITVKPGDDIRVDGKRLPRPEPARLWRYHKPKGLITTNRDDDGRATIFEKLPEHLPRVITVGRLDMNTEGLLLLTNDGDLARHLELPETGWLRRYRVRAFGRVDQADLDLLRKGPVVDGIVYGSVVARVERQQGDNVWLIVDLREGKNREVKRVLQSINLDVNRLIRVSYGPFTLDNMARGEVAEVPRRILSQQVPERFRQGRDSQRRVQASPSSPNTLKLRGNSSDSAEDKSPGRRIGSGRKQAQKPYRDDKPRSAAKRKSSFTKENTERSVKKRSDRDPSKRRTDETQTDRPNYRRNTRQNHRHDGGQEGRRKDNPSDPQKIRPNVRSKPETGRPGRSAQTRSGDKSNNRPGSNNKLGGKTGGKPSNKSGGRPGSRPGEKFGGKPGNKPGSKFGGKGGRNADRRR